MTPLNDAEIEERLATVGDWHRSAHHSIVRELSLPDFAAAIAFVNRVAELAESEDHHPDVDVRWNKVTLRWMTHSQGEITDRDRELAARSAELA